MNDVQFKHLCSVDTVLDWGLTILEDLVLDLPQDDEYRTYLNSCYRYLSKYWTRVSMVKEKEVKNHAIQSCM